MIIRTVKGVKTNNSKANLTNYNTNSHLMSAMDNSESIADSFVKSNQVSFKGSLAKVGEDLLSSGEVKKAGKEALESVGANIEKLLKRKELPFSEEPIIAEMRYVPQNPFTNGTKFTNTYDQNAQSLLSSLQKNNIDITSIGTITRDVNGGLQPIDHRLIRGKLDAAVSDGTIDSDLARSLKDQLNFCGIPETVKDAAIEAGSAIASSAAGETVKTIASEVGQYVAEEVLGEGAAQSIERTVDAFAPGAGVALTGFRWGRRGYKAAKAAGGAIEYLTEKFYEATTDISGLPTPSELSEACEREIDRLIVKYCQENHIKFAQKDLDAVRKKFAREAFHNVTNRFINNIVNRLSF